MVFDITKKETFDLINYWEDFIKKNSKPNIGKILFGNKLDLENEREVEYEEGKNLANKLNCEYYEGSAKTGDIFEGKFIIGELTGKGFHKNNIYKMKASQLFMRIK